MASFTAKLLDNMTKLNLSTIPGQIKKKLLLALNKIGAIANQSNSECPFHPFSKLPLSPEKVSLVVDVGAFSGYYSLKALSYYPNCKVIAFEPSSDNIQLFKNNINEPSSSRITIHKSAVSNEIGESVLNITSYGPAHSLEPQSKEHYRQNPHAFEIGKENVKVVTLDDILSSEKIIDVLKIDTEGHEVKVLQGARSILEKTRYVIIEVSLARDTSPSEQNVFAIFKLLQASGFSLYSIIDLYPFEQPASHLGMAQFDAVFKNASF
jgi:FkbM family methyltransferase